jgi:hypothetical protein
VNAEMVARVRDALPPRLNAGILMGDGGCCILGWMIIMAGFHPITIYANTNAVVDQHRGGPAIDVVAREYGLDRDVVVELARLNDRTPTPQRNDAVRARLTEILEGAELEGDQAKGES